MQRPQVGGIFVGKKFKGSFSAAVAGFGVWLLMVRERCVFWWQRPVCSSGSFRGRIVDGVAAKIATIFNVEVRWGELPDVGRERFFHL